MTFYSVCRKNLIRPKMVLGVIGTWSETVFLNYAQLRGVRLSKRSSREKTYLVEIVFLLYISFFSLTFSEESFFCLFPGRVEIKLINSERSVLRWKFSGGKLTEKEITVIIEMVFARHVQYHRWTSTTFKSLDMITRNLANVLPTWMKAVIMFNLRLTCYGRKNSNIH